MYERTSVILLVTYLLQFSEQKKDRLVSLDSFHIGQNRRLDRTAESSVEWATNIFFCFSFHFDKSIYYLLQNLNLDKKTTSILPLLADLVPKNIWPRELAIYFVKVDLCAFAFHSFPQALSWLAVSIENQVKMQFQLDVHES